MKKRNVLLIVGMLAACVVTLGVLAALPARPGVTKANFERIKMGMTIEEATALFQMAPDYSAELLFDEPIRWKIKTWHAADGSGVQLMFNDDGVTGKAWIESKDTMLEKILRLFHLR